MTRASMKFTVQGASLCQVKKTGTVLESLKAGLRQLWKPENFTRSQISVFFAPEKYIIAKKICSSPSARHIPL
jgi:hypothetical protein